MVSNSQTQMLKDSLILVTGGLGRLGQAILEQVEMFGGIPIATTRDAERAAQFNELSEAKGLKRRAVQSDMKEPADVSELVNGVVSRFGSISGLVNNAYFMHGYRSPGYESWSVWPDASLVGLAIPEALSAEIIERKTQTGITSIVNVASMYATVAPDFSIYETEERRSPCFYGAVKAAMMQMTRYHAVHWADAGVRVNSVSPGGIFNDQEEGFLKRYNLGVPIGRMVTRQEVASVICFLLSDQSSGIIGQDIVVDGGRTII